MTANLPDLDAVTLESQRAKQGIKWSRDPGAIGAWVADMDFPPALEISAALQRLIDQDDLGYLGLDFGQQVVASFAKRMAAKFQWSIDPADVVIMGDVVQGLNTAVFTLTEPGDGIAVTSPIYHPFLYAIEENGRRVVSHQLERDAGWALDVERLAAAIDSTTSMLMFCNPHNPLGRVFTREELEPLAALVVERDLVVISDEIHADLVFDGSHIPFASLSDAVAERTITMNSATKAFNIAGVRCSVAHFGGSTIRERFQAVPPKVLGSVSTFGMLATIAAWDDGEPWLDHVMAYLRANREHLVARITAEVPGAQVHSPEATYLAWIDCSELGLGDDPSETLLADADLALSPGAQFGDGGAGHVRLNFATSRQILDEIIDRLAAAATG